MSLAMLNCAGFLSTEDSSAPGNYAILDLVAALHWIKENIAAFGGDADQVSLLGHGYGAALVNILLISPITKGITIIRSSKYERFCSFWCDLTYVEPVVVNLIAICC